MAHDVFISYAAEDLKVAEQVCRALEQEGIRCWMAPRDVPIGVPFEQAILDAIEASQFLVLIHSAHANASQHVEREIQNACAEGSRTRVIPLRIETVPYSGAILYYLRSTQRLDATTPPLEGHLRRLADYVRAHLRPPEEKLPAYSMEAAPLPAGWPLPTGWWLAAAGSLLLVLFLVLAAYRPSRNEYPAYGPSVTVIPDNENAVAANLTDGNANAVANGNRGGSAPAPPTPSPKATATATDRNTPTPTPQRATVTPAEPEPTPEPPPDTESTPMLPTDSPLISLGDARIELEVAAALSKYPEFKNVKVTSQDGKVTLTGYISLYTADNIEPKKKLARQTAEAIPHVKSVRLRVKGVIVGVSR